jgi:hypothetical protein
VNTGYFTDLQGGLHVINGAHNNTIVNDDFSGDTSGISIGSGGNGFYFNACAGAEQTFSPVEAAMGAGNTFTNICYFNTDIRGLPRSDCKS